MSGETIGCVLCGEEFERHCTVWAECGACGKAVGICLGCADKKIRGARILMNESIRWHQQHGGCRAKQVDDILARMMPQSSRDTPKAREAARRAAVLNYQAASVWRRRVG